MVPFGPTLRRRAAPSFFVGRAADAARRRVPETGAGAEDLVHPPESDDECDCFIPEFCSLA